MISSRFLTLLCLSPLLTSCTVGPDYQRPQDTVPATWVNAPDTTMMLPRTVFGAASNNNVDNFYSFLNVLL